MEHHVDEDCRALLSELKKEEKALALKRRWLMDLPLSERERKRMKKLNPFVNKVIPETLLREDDVYYDDVRAFVERGFGVHNFVKEHYFTQEDVQPLDSFEHLKNLLSLVEEMTNKELCCLAELLTDGLVEFEKTKWKMKKIIKQYLPVFLNEKNKNFQIRMEKLSCLLKDPQYFRRMNRVPVSSRTDSFRIAALRLLDKLEELPPQALSAMHRKLKGEKGYIPKLQHARYRRKRDLIGPVRSFCVKMLSKLGEEEEPKEPLVKAMTIASLTLKRILGYPSVTEFQEFPPEIEALQNDIAEAIRLIDSEKKVSILEIEASLQKLYHLPDPKFVFSKRSLRSALRNLLTEYLFECSNMDSVPESLLEVLSDINRRYRRSSYRRVSKEEVEEEVEFLLCMSAQTKQIIWDSFPGLEVDQDFANGYMEDLDESDNDDEEEVDMPQNCKFRLGESNEFTESTGETNPFTSESPVSKCEGDYLSSLLSPSSRLNIKLESVDITEKDSIQSCDFAHYSSCPGSKMYESAESFDTSKQLLSSLKIFKCSDLHSPILMSHQNACSSSLSPHGSGSVYEVKRQETLNDSVRNERLPSPNGEKGNFHHKECMSRNQYLAIQNACDETNMAMYRIIGGMLNKFAEAQHLKLRPCDVTYLQTNASIPNESTVSKDSQSPYEGDICSSVLTRVLEELMPSFSESAKRKLKKLMGTI